MTTVLLARHGETTWNRERRVQGWAPTALTDRGHEQATTLGSWLTDRYDVDRLLASDLRRTRETTTGVLAAGDGLPAPTFDRGWRERAFGVYQGFLTERLFERYPDHDFDTSVSALDIDPKGGESIAQFGTRVRRSWETLCGTVGPDETVVVVTHGGVVKRVRALVTDCSLPAALSAHSPPNCSVMALDLDGDSVPALDTTTPWRQ